MPGYTGIECTFECPYPSFGNDCQGYCRCSIELCDVARGCRSPKLENTFTSQGLRSLTAGTVISYKLHVNEYHELILLVLLHLIHYWS